MLIDWAGVPRRGHRQDITAECVHAWLVLCCLVRLRRARSLVACVAHAVVFAAGSEPTVFENYVHDLYVDEQLVELSLWDTAGAFTLRASTVG